MATPDYWRIYLMPDDNTWMYEDDNGELVTTTDSAIGMAHPLRDVPENWEEIEDSYTRSDDLDGVFTKNTGEYIFAGDGAHIIRHHIFTYGYTAQLKMVTYARNEDNWQHELYDASYLSFEKPPVEGPEYKVTALLYESGLAQDLKTNLDTDYEIPLDGGVKVFFAGTRVRGKYNYKYTESATLLPWPSSFGTGQEIYKNVLIVQTTSEGFKPVVLAQNANILPSNTFLGRASDAMLTTDEPFVMQNIDVQDFDDFVLNQADIKINVMYLGSTAPVTVQVGYYLIIQAPGENIRLTHQFYLSAPVVMTNTVNYTFEDIPDIVDFVIPLGLQENERVFITPSIKVNAGVTPNGFFEIRTFDTEITTLSLQVSFNSTASFVNGLRQPDMFKALGEKIAAGNYGPSPTSSVFLNDPANRIVDNYPYHTLLTNGLEIKGVTNTMFKITMGDFIKHCKALYPVGVGVENNVIFIEHLNKFYDDTVTIGNLGEATAVKIIPRNSVTSKYLFGWKFNDNDDILNGRDDYNTVINYRAAGRFQTESTTEFVSPFTASVYETERARVEEQGKDSTGNKVNDQIFVFSVFPDNAGGDWFLSYPAQTGGIISGVLYPDWTYNVDLSPGRIRERQRPLLNSYCYPSTLPFTYQISERNGEMISKFQKTISPITYYPQVIEKDSFVPNADDRIFADYDFEGQFIIPFNLKQLMAPNPKGAFDITIEGKPARIFIDEISCQKVSRNTFDVKGRFTASTDMLQFIKM